uniref:Nuclease HARBI1 n=1 Tax=Geotrypetes seraphini TaxID=260995 RepID=A0A6P8PB34_GEOSA|nr:putative nuclease HARBI1 [Geotrypetes seraphini]XP_033778085.1 putative nuclease HARBI1 [Geotrypetes seraphini]XP_033778175.1 putative nuclease HARBI1 [Geotrypetes seraphini]
MLARNTMKLGLNAGRVAPWWLFQDHGRLLPLPVCLYEVHWAVKVSSWFVGPKKQSEDTSSLNSRPFEAEILCKLFPASSLAAPSTQHGTFLGSCHDSCILSNCARRQKFSDGTLGQRWLLGNGGYACKPWLMTPLMSPHSEAERYFSEAPIATGVPLSTLLGC